MVSFERLFWVFMWPHTVWKSSFIGATCRTLFSSPSPRPAACATTSRSEACAASGPAWDARQHDGGHQVLELPNRGLKEVH